jgi:ribonuclease-3
LTDWAGLQSNLGITFENLSLLKQAFVHTSYLNENPTFDLPSNERLEFLGDAVLGLAVADELYRRYPDLTEGEMTKFRSNLVSGKTLAHLAASLHLGDYLYLGKGEEIKGGRGRESNLAAVMEAVLGAIFLEHGFAMARDLTLRLLGAELERITEEGSVTDYKSRLQEVVQAREQITPSYHTIEVVGPAHDRMFTVEVMIGDAMMGRGRGKRKQVAENEAARVALEKLSLSEDC